MIIDSDNGKGTLRDKLERKTITTTKEKHIDLSDEIQKEFAKMLDKDGIDEDTGLFRALREVFENGAGSLDQFFDSLSDPALKDFIESLSEAEKTTITVGDAMKRMTTQVVTSTEKVKWSSEIFKSFSKIAKGVFAFATNAVVTMAASWAIEKTVESLYNWIHAEEIAIEKGEKAKEKLSEINSEYEKISSVESSVERFGKLRDSVNTETNDNVSLTNEEYSEYIDLCNQIADIYPSLVTSYDEQGNAILNLGNNAEEATAKIKELSDVQKQMTYNEAKDQIGSFLTGSFTKVDQYNKEIEEIESKIADANEVIGTAMNDSLITDRLYDMYNTQKITYTDSTVDLMLNTVMKRLIENSDIEFNGNRSTNYDDNGNVIDYYQEIQGFPATQEEWNKIVDRTMQDIEVEIPIVYTDAGFEKTQALSDITANESKRQSEFNSMISEIQSFVKNEANYNTLPEEIQNLIQKYIANTDMTAFPKLAEDDYADYIEETYIKPFSNLYNYQGADEYAIKAKDALTNLYGLSENSGKTKIGEYDKKLDAQLQTIEEYWKNIYGEERGEEYYKEFVLKLGFKIEDENGNLISSNDDLINNIKDKAELKGEDISDLNFDRLTVSQLIEFEDVVTDSAFGDSIANVYENITKKVEQIDSEKLFSSLLASEDVSEKIDDFQSSISSLDTALDTLKQDGRLDMDALSDLQREFPELIGHTNDLQVAISDLKLDKIEDFTVYWKEILSQLSGEEADKAKEFINGLIPNIDTRNADDENYVSTIRHLLSQNSTTMAISGFLPNWDQLIAEFGETSEGRSIILSMAADADNIYKTFEELKTQFENTEENSIVLKFSTSEESLETLQNEISDFSTEAQRIQNDISQKQSNGDKSISSNYRKLVKNSNSQIKNIKQQNQLLRFQQTLLRRMGLDETSAKYREIEQQINENVASIDEAYLNQLEWNEAADALAYEPNEGLTAYNKAKESRNAGDNYLDMLAAATEAQEAREKGLIGTDDFTTVAKMFSPDGMTDAANWDENYGKIKKYFTEDAQGVKAFLNDLSTKTDKEGKALARCDETTGEWAYSIEDVQYSADQLGISFEAFLAIMGRLQDYGFTNDFFTSVEDGQEHIADLYFDLHEAESELQKLKSDKANGDTTITDTVLSEQEARVNQIKQSILESQDLLTQLASRDVSDFEAKQQSKIQSILTMLGRSDEVDEGYLQGYLGNIRSAILDDPSLEFDLGDLITINDDGSLAVNLEKQLALEDKYGVDLELTTEFQDENLNTIKDSIEKLYNDEESNAKELIASIAKYTSDELSTITFGDGEYGEYKEAEAAIDQLITKLGLSQEQGTLLLQLLGELGYIEFETDTTDLDEATEKAKEDVQKDVNFQPNTAELDTETEKAKNPIVKAINFVKQTLLGAADTSESATEDTATVTVNANTDPYKESVSEVISDTNNESSSVIVKANTSRAVSTVNNLLSQLNRATATIKISADTSSLLSKITSSLSSFGGILSLIIGRSSGTFTYSGNAFANGTVTPSKGIQMWNSYRASVGAYANGTNVGLDRDEFALVNEQNPEGLVRDGVFQVMQGGAHFEHLKRGDIIFNAKQTEELLKYGRVTSGGGHGRTIGAYAKGTPENYGSFNISSSSSTSSSSASNAANNISNAANDISSALDDLIAKLNENIQDWIAVRRETLQNLSDLNVARSENQTKYADKNKKLNVAQTHNTQLLSDNRAGYKKYLEYADYVAKQVGLSDALKKKVQNGTIQIQSLSEDDKKRVEAYKQWYDLAWECNLAIEEVISSQRDLERQKLDNIIEYYDALASKIDHTATMLEGLQEKIELKGYVESTSLLNDLVANEKKRIKNLKNERTALVKSLQESIDSGIIKVNSIEWHEMQDEINATTEAIQEADNAILEYANSIRDIKWAKFDAIQEEISTITDETNFLIGLMENDKLFEDTGKITEKGMATAGLRGTNYNTYMRQADMYASEIKSIDKKLANDKNNITLLERRKELLQLQRDSITAAEDEKQAIKSLVEEGINKQLESLDTLIDKYLDALDSQKSLYDYQKQVNEQTSEIAKLEKRKAAYEGDTSEEGRLKYQQISNELEQARDNLKESEYDKFISDQKELLDDLREDYETVLNERLENIDALINSVINVVNDKSGEIAATLKEEAKSIGTTLSDAMNAIWNSEDGNALVKYSKKFSSKLTTLNAAVADLKKIVEDRYKESDSMAKIDAAALQKEKDKYTVDTVTAKPSTKPNTKPTTGTSSSSSSNKNNTTSSSTAGMVSSLSGKYQIGSTGSDVGKIQKALNALGYTDNYGSKLTVDNNFGERTRQAVVKFQKAMNILADGVVWNETKKAFKLKGYAKGTDYVPETNWYNLNENGQEIIARPDGSIIMPLVQGSAVVNNPNTEKIIALANNFDAVKDMISTAHTLGSTKQLSNIESIARKISDSNITNNTESTPIVVNNNFTLNLPNVQKPEDFIKWFQSSHEFENIISDIIGSKLTGKSSLTKYKKNYM